MHDFFNYFYINIITGKFDLLGFIGAMFGVIGAYMIASYQFRKQQKIEKNYAIDMLCCLLDSTLVDTEYVIPKFIDGCKCFWENKYYMEYLEKIDEYHLKEEAKNFISKAAENFYSDENKLFFFVSVMEQERFGNLINKFNNHVNKSFKFEEVVYDDNWYNHLKFISDNHKNYRTEIIKWIRLLKTTHVNITMSDDEQGTYLNIYEFIIQRDKIIDFLSEYNYINHKKYKDIFKIEINSKG